MNEMEVQRQIEQMVMFIKQEAEEKANEIRVSAEEEFNLEKLNLLETEQQRIRKEYERKDAQVDASKKIESSKQLNEQRLRMLAARHEAITDVFEAAKDEIRNITGDPEQYAPLTVELLCQAMRKLDESSQIVQCREQDLEVVEACMAVAQDRYAELFECDAPDMTLDRDHFLAPGGESKEQEDDPDFPTCLGGVVLTTMNGRILVNNTLDSRLAIIQAEKLPVIRASLFSEE